LSGESDDEQTQAEEQEAELLEGGQGKENMISKLEVGVDCGLVRPSRLRGLVKIPVAAPIFSLIESSKTSCSFAFS
jgi:hypothetical protein